MIKTDIVEIKTEGLLDEAFSSVRIFTTVEGENPGGSIKDHMVEGELQFLLQQKTIKLGSLISEVSAGSTAVSLAYYGKQYGLKCHLFLPQETPLETQNKLKSLGANLHLAEAKLLYKLHDEFCKESGSYAFNQLFDKQKSRHYHALGKFIQSELKKIDLVIGSVGTGHSIKGIAKAIKNAKVFSAEPVSPLQIKGVRNIEVDRYGEHDPCSIQDFDQRIFVAENECPQIKTLETLTRSIAIGPSFNLVLGALKKLSYGKKFPIILALGANNRYS